MIEIIGWIGILLFCLCAIPQTIKSWKEKSAKGISWAFLIMWISGEILTTIYTIFQPIILIPLVVNYIVNIFLIGIIIYWKFYGEMNEKVNSSN